ncbi:MAG: hypothetical protein LIO85_07800 [Rikenellaceae bacterium]|nr:hypothetical protein [Rikenellaceae bacterium]
MKRISLTMMAACCFLLAHATSPTTTIEIPLGNEITGTTMAATTLSVTFYNFSEGDVNSTLVVSRGTDPINDYVYDGGFYDIPRMKYASVNDIQLDSYYTIYNIYLQISSSTGFFTSQYIFDTTSGGTRIDVTLEDNRAISYRYY